MNDAVQENFFLLNFAHQLLVGEKRIARRLQPLLLLAEGAQEIAYEEDGAAIEPQGRGFQRRLIPGFAALDPVAGIRGAVLFGLPEFFGVHEKVFKKGRMLAQANRCGALELRAPGTREPGREISNRAEDAVSQVLEKGESLLRQKRFQDVVRRHARYNQFRSG